MQLFIKKFILYIFFPIIILYGSLEFLIRRIPNDYSYKNKWISEHSSNIRILSVGASHGYYGINPLYFSEKAFNGSHVSETFNYDLFLIKKFIPHYDSLQYIILPVSYMSFFNTLETSIEPWRAKNYTIYYNCQYHRFEPKYNFAFYDATLQTLIKRVKSYYINKKSERDCSDLGFGEDHHFVNRDLNWEKTGKKAADRHTVKNFEEEYNKNLSYLNEIIKICNTRKIKLIMLTTPTWHTYSDNLDKNQLAITINTCNTLVKQNSNVTYLNLLNDTRFDSNDFFDADHLDEIGAKKLTKIINDTLYRIQSIH